MSFIATSKNAVIYFKSVATGSLLLGGFANDNIMEVADTDIVKTTIGCDGQRNLSVIAKEQEGSFTFFPSSPSLQKIYTAQQAVYLTGLPLTGILTVTLPTSAKVFTYPEFTFKSAAKGISLGDEQKPVTIKWSALLPDVASLGAIAQELISLI